MGGRLNARTKVEHAYAISSRWCDRGKVSPDVDTEGNKAISIKQIRQYCHQSKVAIQTEVS